MAVLILIFLMYKIFKNVNLDNLKSTLFKLIGTIILISVLGSLLTSVMFSPFGLIGLIGVAIYYGKLKEKKKLDQENKDKYGWDPENWDRVNQNRDTYANVSKPMEKTPDFPKKAAVRKKICESFNKEYRLCLTDDQVMGIVNSSYMSEIWLGELMAMNKKYENVYQWFNGPTNWLRVYLYAFHVQQVTSDIRAQETIAMYAFQEVFEYTDQISGTLADKIEKANSKFLTGFDDVSFMIAYRFLEEKGLKHKLGDMDLIRNDSEIDKLLDKYKDEKGDGKTFPMS